LDLAHVYLILKNRESALDALESVLKIDPGNDAARQEWVKVGAVPDKNK
jgi:Tfp pilus assembly protein PilF